MAAGWVLGCLLVLGEGKVSTVYGDDCSYRLLGDGFEFRGAKVAVVVGDEWRPLECVSTPEDVHGKNEHGWEYSGWKMKFGTKELGHVMTTFGLNFGQFVVFTFQVEQELVVAGSKHDELFSSFPAFIQEKNGLEGRLSWKGSFVQADNKCTEGTQGGPCLIYNSSNPTTGNALMFSALDNFPTTSHRTKLWNNTKVIWAASTVATVKKVPRGFKHSFMAFSGNEGITDTINEWGKLLQKMYKTWRVDDITVSTLGYQTDNGAQYCSGCANGCDQILLNELAYLKGISVPIKYLSYQNAWWHGTGSAPWCVSDWDWVPSRVPMGVPEFHRRAGMPFQLYAPYFCMDTKYAKDFKFISSNPNLPTCGQFKFKEIAPEESLKFYDWFISLGMSYGMQSFEADFMNQNLNCVDRFLEEIGAAAQYMDGMTQAAFKHKIPIQWCFVSPSGLLQTLKYPSVTNLRGSTDYAYGNSWDMGLSSLFLWAMNTAPSKDTFWTSDNGDMATKLDGCGKKGCPPDHSDDGCELHTILAIMSTGPVGFSDAINHTNPERIMKTCTSDGLLLKPNKPLTTLDDHHRKYYHVLQTYSGPRNDNPTSGSKVWAYYLLGHHLDRNAQGVHIRLGELWPRPSASTEFFLYKSGNPGCLTDGAPAESCVSKVEGSDIHFDKTKSAFESSLYTVVPSCVESGWALVGEVNKYVSLSNIRFSQVECLSSDDDSGAIRVTIRGAPSENIVLSFVGPDTPDSDTYKVHLKHVTIPPKTNFGSFGGINEDSLEPNVVTFTV
eukprot:CAMPEP_0203748480 /NCGR_PEP_ID=MMETSP0098-20131031/3351_1 /ASSEMBLY_ACC=CAM_ASM_000208 /TAXON_ID=96639 /ORGANISM=" , Strain NY0313808BC1" /LENGTH=778 /DNA_ID=CAMNT_0050637239 /DNA_START=35 /DNA_END=2371 /DNA_ORIENTATION=+